MLTKVHGENSFQVLTGAFSISPSQSGYNLEISADGRNFSPIFTVGAGVTRLVTGVAANSYYRLAGNTSDVVINWQKSCSDGGSGGGNAGQLEPVTEFPLSPVEGTVVALASGDTVGVYQYDGSDWVSVGGDLSNYYTKAETDAEISAATSPIQEQIDDVERVTASALTELHDAILEISGSTGSGPIIPAINTQAEYEAISGDVKSGDLIQVRGVDINGDNNPESGLFEADVQEEESDGVVRKIISWGRRDSIDSVLWSGNAYPWMVDNDVNPIELGVDTFIISSDMTAEDEAYNGIGFDADGKPVITHIAPAYDDEAGAITGITREDRAIVAGEGINRIVKLTQAEYDAIATPDASTLYIIINN